MMEWWKVGAACFGALLLFVVGIYVGGTMIDGRIDMGTEASIEAPQTQVYEYVATGEGVVQWWTAAGAEFADSGYPPLDISVIEPGGADGVGLHVRFSSDGTVMEDWTVISASPPESVVWRVDFAGMMEVERTLSVRTDGDGCIVGWHEVGTIDNPMFRYMTLMMPPEDIVKNFDGALTALKKEAEK